jgi:cell division protein FtsI (penicillin-binding protein 3)
VQPETAFTVPWRMQIEDRLFKDAEEHNDEYWSVHDIVRESSNVGVIKIASLLGKERLDEYQRKFGFGKKTAIGFPYESAGLMKNVWEYVPADMGSVPIGYTTAVTPMQMLDVFTTVANGGVSVPPRLVAGTIAPDGTRRDMPRPKGERVISATTAEQLNQMLRSVVTDGTGEQAAISGYTVAGKTGTSRKPPYEPTPRYMASFAGFAPAEAPRLAAIVVIDQPGTSNEEYFGGKVAAPLFSTIMQYALHLERVPPTTPMAGQPLVDVSGGSTSKVAQGGDRRHTTPTATRPAGASTAPVATGPPGIVGRPTS